MVSASVKVVQGESDKKAVSATIKFPSIEIALHGRWFLFYSTSFIIINLEAVLTLPGSYSSCSRRLLNVFFIIIVIAVFCFYCRAKGNCRYRKWDKAQSSTIIFSSASTKEPCSDEFRVSERKEFPRTDANNLRNFYFFISPFHIHLHTQQFFLLLITERTTSF